jgi:GMP synthase (glutamine-hydrolysing)
MARFLIVKTGSTVSNVVAQRGDFEAWITRGLGVPGERVEVCSVHQEEVLPAASALSDFAGVVVTGSPAMVTERHPWSERTAAWLREAVSGDVAVLGICYGHQLLAHAFGGRVDTNPHGRNIGTIDVALNDSGARDALLGALGPVLHVPVSHMQSVLELPQGATLLATTARDPHHAFAIGRRAWGVQFHPEFDADIVRGYVAARRDIINAEGLDAVAIEQAARDTDHGPRVLRRFAELCMTAGRAGALVDD